MSARVLAIIPARMGSKRLPSKNLLDIEPGLSLVAQAAQCARRSGMIDEVYVLSDGRLPAGDLADVSGLVQEPAHLADDHADISAAVAYATQVVEQDLCTRYDYVVTLQPAVLARSPLIVNRVMRAVLDARAGGAVTAARTVPWLWEVADGKALNAWTPGPYPRSAACAPRLAEINAVQVACRAAVADRQRWALPLLLAELPPWAAALDIDEPHDLALARDFWPWARPRLETHEPTMHRADTINGAAA